MRHAFIKIYFVGKLTQIEFCPFQYALKPIQITNRLICGYIESPIIQDVETAAR